MACFALFTGSLYNELFSIPFNAFGTCFKECFDKGGTCVRTPSDCVYTWGIDPVWFNATNDLLFVNAFKMKWAVILGVITMVFGIILKAVNSVYFRDGLTFFFEFIP
jgi:V-type H+-transporting ATPase subunit a